MNSYGAFGVRGGQHWSELFWLAARCTGSMVRASYCFWSRANSVADWRADDIPIDSRNNSVVAGDNGKPQPASRSRNVKQFACLAVPRDDTAIYGFAWL